MEDKIRAAEMHDIPVDNIRKYGPVGIRTPDHEVSPGKTSEASRPIRTRLQALPPVYAER